MATRRDLLFATGVLAGVSMVTRSGAAASTSVLPASQSTDGYAHPEWLVDAEWLIEHFDERDLVVVALQAEDDFATGHIPGSARIDWPELEIVDTTAASLEAWRTQVAAKIGELGIGPTSTVVIYDAETLWGARIWWLLDQFGHPDKRILNGGYSAWNAAGGGTEIGASQAIAAGAYPVTPNEDAIATIDEVKAAVAAGSATFVDARAEQEFTDGHLPGAIDIPYAGNAIAGSPKYFKPADELLAMYEAAGVHPDGLVIPYCTSGVRSAVTYFTLRLIGYEQVSLFTGSWNEWSRDPSLPVKTGDDSDVG